MGQQEIYEILKKNKNKWISVKDIEEVYESSTIRCTLQRMLKNEEVIREARVNENKNTYYVYKLI